MYGREKGEERGRKRRKEEKGEVKREWKKKGEEKLKRRRWEKEEEARERRNAAHRETEEAIVVVRRDAASTIETEVVRVRSIRISSSWPVDATVARVSQWTST